MTTDAPVARDTDVFLATLSRIYRTLADEVGFSALDNEARVDLARVAGNLAKELIALEKA